MKRYLVRLEAEERARLEQLVRVGKAAAYRIRHANIVLAVDESEAGPKLKDAQAAEAFGVAVRSIESLRKRGFLRPSSPMTLHLRPNRHTSTHRRSITRLMQYAG